MKIDFYDSSSIADSKITFVVMVARYQGQWILVRHRERATWEIPGGHREAGESLEEAARRELYEETGAREFELIPVGLYSVTSEGKVSYGRLYLAEVSTLGALPESEIREISLEKEFPSGNLTYPMIQPSLYKRVIQYLKLENSR